jgi:RNA recognition motif-containing protein
MRFEEDPTNHLLSHKTVVPQAQPPDEAASRHISFLEVQMGKKLYVGNLSHETGNSELEKMFEPYGTVQSAPVSMDRDTGRSKGFGFVEMASDAEAKAAIAGLPDKQVDVRSLNVNEARPKEDRGDGGRGGSGGGRQAKDGKAGGDRLGLLSGDRPARRKRTEQAGTRRLS